MTRQLRLVSTSILAIALTAAGAHAGNLIVNGDFETGDYTGWNANVEPGSDGQLTVVANAGEGSPLSGYAMPFNPGGGSYFSVSDQYGPGSYSLTQSFTLSSATTVSVSFQMFVNDQYGTPAANGRDYNTNPNQNAEVDILTGTADPFTNAPADIVSVLYGPAAIVGGSDPWTDYASSLSLAAGTYQIRFAETDNQGYFQQGVDNVSISASVPEPASWAMMLIGCAGLGALLRGSRRCAPRPGAAT